MTDHGDVLLETAYRIAAGDDVDWQRLCRSPTQDWRIIENLRKIAVVAERFAKVPAYPANRSDPVSAESAARKHSFTWGHLKIIESIGSGGFGEVFRAYDPILCRDVALKLRHPTAGSDSSARIFIEEARRIARVRHPNVLAIHGADVRDGRVGLWSDLLSGKTLEMRLQAGDRIAPLEIFRIAAAIASALEAICKAGLIHGDVKASNVMLEHDGRVVLMDFGAGGEVSGSNRMPMFASPLSAAPELFDGEPASTASDQYSFGVLLHRMLHGRYPVEADTIDDLVCAHERKKSGAFAVGSGTDSPMARLATRLLQFAPESRPGIGDTVQELRRIEGLPARRRRTAVIATIMLILAGGTLATSIGFLRARKSEARATATASELTSVNGFLQSVLESPRPTDGGRQTSVMELMDRAVQQVDTDLASNPAARARTLFIVGETYVHMYLWGKAEAALRKSLALREEVLGAQHPDTLYSRAMLAAAIAGLEQHDAAEVILSPVFIALPNVPLDHPVQSQARITRAHIAFDREDLGLAQSLFEDLLVFRSDINWPDEPNYGVAELELAKILELRGDYEAAMLHAQTVLDWSVARNGERHQRTLNARQLIAIVYDRLGQADKTLELMKESLAVAEEWLGEDDRFTYIALTNVAEASYRAGYIDEALTLQRHVMEIKDNFYPPEHFNSLGVDTNYASMLSEVGQFTESEERLRNVLHRAERHLGETHHLTFEIRMQLADVLLRSGQANAAYAYAGDLRPAVAVSLGETHLYTLQVDRTLGSSLVALGKYSEGERLLRETLATQRKTHGALSSDTLKTEFQLALAVRELRPVEAGIMLHELVGKFAATVGVAHPKTESVRAELARMPH